MQRSIQDGFASRFPHHRRVYEPAVAHLQGRGSSRTLATAPPIGEFLARDEASLASGYVWRALLGLLSGLHRVFLHTLSIVTVCTSSS